MPSDHNAEAAAGTAETAQARFDRLYMSSSEICRALGVTRTTVLAARRRGLLPEPIAVNGCTLYIWERATAAPYVEAWKLILHSRRAHNAAQVAQQQATAALQAA